MVHSHSTAEEEDTPRLNNFFQLTQLVRDGVGFGILTPEPTLLAFCTDIPGAEEISIRLGVSWFLNPCSLLTTCVSWGELLYLSEFSFLPP